MNIKIIRFRTLSKDFDKNLVSFFILEGSKNMQIIQIDNEHLIFQVEIFAGKEKNINTEKMLDKFRKFYPNKYIDIQLEKDIDFEEWKRMRLRSLSVGKFTFKPIFDKTEEDDSVIYLDTLVGAFGIDNHPTTIICLEMIDKMEPKFKLAVDFGSGNGILSLALSRISKSPIIAIEIFYSYCLEIKHNCKINNTENIIVLNSDSMKVIKELDFLVSNVPLSVFADPNTNILNSKFNKAVFSGIKIESKEEFINLLDKYNIEILEIVEKEGWIGVITQKQGR
ncbi:MAG: 50S ribosomal protein L11 methyltransferase [Candidatus Calescibacterium sp.]|nr:50S ribosomal protein L11 methyltransferase [Candidatus Calescibacterium sp.]MDW8132907.1 50S ribosomal protein L11 methyltransferase [Candidatus Calescibacterium sp.]